MTRAAGETGKAAGVDGDASLVAAVEDAQAGRVPGTHGDDGGGARGDGSDGDAEDGRFCGAGDSGRGCERALLSDEGAIDVEFVGHQSILVAIEEDGEWNLGAAADGDVGADPDVSIGVEGWGGELAVEGSGPGAVVESGVGVRGVVAEVVAEQGLRCGWGDLGGGGERHESAKQNR